MLDAACAKMAFYSLKLSESRKRKSPASALTGRCLVQLVSSVSGGTSFSTSDRAKHPQLLPALPLPSFRTIN